MQKCTLRNKYFVYIYDYNIYDYNICCMVKQLRLETLFLFLVIVIMLIIYKIYKIIYKIYIYI